MTEIRCYFAPAIHDHFLIPRISILLLRSFVGPFVVTFLVAMFIFEMQFIWVYLDDMMGKGLSLAVFIKLFLYASARLVNMALPLAILMSSIMTMGSLAENNELTAMKSAGVPLHRILRPLIVFHLLLALGAFAFANNVAPIANLKFRTLLFGIVKQKPALNLDSGVFYNGIEGISIRVGNKDPQTEELTDVLIYDHRDRAKGNRTVIRAQSGRMEQTKDKRYLQFTLYNGVSYDEPLEKSKRTPEMPLVRSTFGETTLLLDLSSFAFKADDEEIFKNSYEMMTIAQLSTSIDSLRSQYDTTTQRITKSALAQFHFNQSTQSTEAKTVPSIDELMNENDRAAALRFAIEVTRRNKDVTTSKIDELTSRQKFLIRHQIEWHRKFFLAVVCMVLFFVGAPLGAIIRKGGLGLPTVIALALFIFYQLLTIAGEKMAKSMIVAPWVGMWISTAVLLPISIWITYKASKEAVLFNRDGYMQFFQRVSRLLRREKSSGV